MTTEQIEEVYDTMTGQLCGSRWNGQVENLFSEGSICDRLYAQVYEAYDSIMRKLKLRNEDADVDIIINNLLEIARIQAFEMFRYGQKFAKQNME